MTAWAFRLLSGDGDHITLGRVHGSFPEERLGNAGARFLGSECASCHPTNSLVKAALKYTVLI